MDPPEPNFSKEKTQSHKCFLLFRIAITVFALQQTIRFEFLPLVQHTRMHSEP
jgi:hypothetical protein